MVADLISRKTAQGQYEPNPDFPTGEDYIFFALLYHSCNSSPYIYIYIYIIIAPYWPLQELRLYWCWSATIESDSNSRVNEVGTQSSGRIDAKEAKNLMP